MGLPGFHAAENFPAAAGRPRPGCEGCHQGGGGRRAADAGRHRSVHGRAARPRIGQCESENLQCPVACLVRSFAVEKEEQVFDVAGVLDDFAVYIVAAAVTAFCRKRIVRRGFFQPDS